MLVGQLYQRARNVSPPIEANHFGLNITILCLGEKIWNQSVFWWPNVITCMFLVSFQYFQPLTSDDLNDLWPLQHLTGFFHLLNWNHFCLSSTSGFTNFTGFSDFDLLWPQVTFGLCNQQKVLILTRMDEHTKYELHSRLGIGIIVLSSFDLKWPLTSKCH